MNYITTLSSPGKLRAMAIKRKFVIFPPNATLLELAFALSVCALSPPPALSPLPFSLPNRAQCDDACGLLGCGEFSRTGSQAGSHIVGISGGDAESGGLSKIVNQGMLFKVVFPALQEVGRPPPLCLPHEHRGPRFPCLGGGTRL